MGESTLSLLALIGFTGFILVGISLIALVGLLVGAIFNLGVSDSTRETLWKIFWAGLVVGGVLLFVFYR